MATNSVAETLKSWEIEEWTSVFLENEIDSQSLLMLDLDTLKELIPPLGPRLKAARKINQLRKKVRLCIPKALSLHDALQEIEREQIAMVRFELSDYYGISHCKAIPARHFREKVEAGVPFYFGHLGYDPQACNLEGTGYIEETNYGDAIFHPDLSTFQRVPWAEDTARVLVYPKYEGEIVAGYPRTIAQRLLEELKQMGFSLYSAHEHEFFVFDAETKKPIIDGVQIRSTLRLAKNAGFVRSIQNLLPEIGIDIESVETEYSPGQYEVSYKPAFGIRAADNAFTYKNGIKEIAQQQGFLATFMTKPHHDQLCAGAHFNHSLWDVGGEQCLMYNGQMAHGLSKVAQHWIAGILRHAPAITVLTSQTVNCLRRIRDHAFAPANATWGIENRSVALRVKVKGERGTYIENRMVSAAGCPYMSLAATLAAGMAGIRNRYELPSPIEKIAYDEGAVPPETPKLPTNMESALKELQNDEVIRGAFGEDFIKCFSALKNYELKLESDASSSGINHHTWAFGYYSEYM